METGRNEHLAVSLFEPYDSRIPRGVLDYSSVAHEVARFLDSCTEPNVAVVGYCWTGVMVPHVLAVTERPVCGVLLDCIHPADRGGSLDASRVLLDQDSSVSIRQIVEAKTQGRNIDLRLRHDSREAEAFLDFAVELLRSNVRTLLGDGWSAVPDRLIAEIATRWETELRCFFPSFFESSLPDKAVSGGRRTVVMASSTGQYRNSMSTWAKYLGPGTTCLSPSCDHETILLAPDALRRVREALEGS